MSSGVYRGRVRVIRTVDQLHTLRAGGCWCVRRRRPPGRWCFDRAGAIAADTGSVLSHTAIVDRKFALPAVVVANATSNLVDGEEVTVDGDPRRGHPLLTRRDAYTHSLRRVQIPAAARSASAPIVDVGFTPAEVVKELPSAMNKLGTSCA